MLLRSKETTIEKPIIKKHSPKFQQISSLQYGSAEHFNISIQLILGGKTINAMALIDSGATSNFIHTNFVQQHNISQKLKEKPIPLEVADGRPISTGHITHSTPSLNLVIKNQDHSEKIIFDIAPLGRHQVILGIPWLKKHNPAIKWSTHSIKFDSDYCKAHCNTRPEWISYPDSIDIKSLPCLNDVVTKPAESLTEIKTSSYPAMKHCSWSSLKNEDTIISVMSLEQQSPMDASALSEEIKNPALPEEFKEFSDVFSKSSADALPVLSKYNHTIPLEEGTKPPFGPIYALSETELKALDIYLKENLDKQFIRPSTSPAGAPILFVKKSDGSLRLCVDYRGLNKITIKNRYPLPLIQESLDRLKSAKYFSKLDLRGAYNLIRINPGEEWKTAFRTRYGLFEYLVMPFGLCNAPASFQGMINEVLREFLDICVIIYLDDILVYSATWEQHIIDVKNILQRLREHQLWAKLEKCKFFQDSVEFLGYIVNREGIEMDKKKIKAVLEWPTPKTIKDVQSFLGFANFYRRFIQSYSKIITPICRLLRKDIPFSWDNKCDSAFKTLKTAFTTAPILTHFSPDQPIVIETDASDFAIGAIISHPDKDNPKILRPIAYHSRKLSPAELNYEIYDKEMLAIVEALRVWRAYTEGSRHQITIYTDHKNLIYFITSKTFTRRQTRWWRDIGGLDFKIIYRAGTTMGKPDALSRRQDYSEGSKASQAPPTLFLKPHQYDFSAMEGWKETEENPSLILAPIQETTQNIQTDIIARIQQLQPQDSALSELIPLLQDIEKPRTQALIGYSLRTDNIILFNNLIYVPDNHQLRLDILNQVHNTRVSGHLGNDKTYRLLARTFYFPHMRAFVNTYVQGCETCTRNKTPRHQPYGLLQPLPIPDIPWQSISMDSIVKLPLSKGFNSILVVVDRLTKMAHFIPYQESGFDAPNLATVFQQHIFRLHGIPKDIISDRGPVFNSKFWRAFTSGLGIKCNFSTAFHPQTDGQTERVNQTLEQYLRMFCSYEQNDWADLLATAEFTYNNTDHSSTNYSPFYANTGYHPLHPSSIINITESQAPSVMKRLEQLQALHSTLKSNMQEAQERYTKYYNAKRQDASNTFKVGDLVWLNRKNIDTTRPSLKLDHKLIGPFHIKAKVNELAFTLDLPPTMDCHPTFGVSLLEKYKQGHRDQPQDPPPRIEIDSHGYERFIPERILDARFENNNYSYLIKWEGYSDEHNTWEPIRLIQHLRLFKQFKQQHPELPFPSSRHRP